MAFDVKQFSEKYLLALEEQRKKDPDGGTTGFELEWNVYDAAFQPVTVRHKDGEPVSFVDYVRADFLPDWLNEFNQREVFHWMTEWATRPHFSAADTVDEGWLLEACLINALAAAGAADDERYYIYHGNLLAYVNVDYDTIPGSWNIAKRRYLERCVATYGRSLATAGMHVNLSLPEALLSLDFMHLAPSERDDGAGALRFDGYKNQVYIEATRLMRAFAALSIAVTASTPMRADVLDGVPVVLLTETDSNRNLTFPNDRTLDVAHLYRSYEDYVRLSYDLIKRGVRFGNNNYTPVRARSSAEPVERIISITSEELQSVYQKGLFTSEASPEDMARKIEQENLMARIDLPMSRVELRTDESGHEPEIDLAHLTLVELLMLNFYADSTFARAFRYDLEDIARVRRNESAAAMYGLKAEIEDPLTGKPVMMRDFLGWTLEQVRPLAQALGRWEPLEPLVEMQRGGPNTAEKIRARIRQEIGERNVIPTEVLKLLAEEREERVRQQVENIGSSPSAKIAALAADARRQALRQRAARIDFTPSSHAIETVYPDKTSEVVALAEQLIRIPSVTNAPVERIDEVMHAAHFISHYLEAAGLTVRLFEDGKYPALLAHFPDLLEAPLMLGGHFDVVPPNPDDGQFAPHVEGDYLWGRGSADMKTVVATYLVWMKDQMRASRPKPAINLMLVGNEENGEADPFGTPHVLEALKAETGYSPSLYVAGERTGEKGSELTGEVCVENRGVIRFRLVASGKAGHTGVAKAQPDMALLLTQAVDTLSQMARARLTTSAADGWVSGVRFSFFNVGQPGVYNIAPSTGEVGVEIRPIPEDNIDGLLDDIREYAQGAGLQLRVEVDEKGIICAPDNPHLLAVLASVREATGTEPRVAKKLPGTSARFAPGGQAIVWGQSGIGPHAADERHYIPSIKPYYDALVALAEKYKTVEGTNSSPKKQRTQAR